MRADELSAPADEERLRIATQPVGPNDRAAAAVVHNRVAHVVTADEGARVAGEVEYVDAEYHDPAATPAPPGGLEPRRLLLAGDAPGGPEVDHDRLAAQRREAQPAAAVESRQDEVGRGRMFPLPHRRRHVPVLVCDLPEEQ